MARWAASWGKANSEVLTYFGAPPLPGFGRSGKHHSFDATLFKIEIDSFPLLAKPARSWGTPIPALPVNFLSDGCGSRHAVGPSTPAEKHFQAIRDARGFRNAKLVPTAAPQLLCTCMSSRIAAPPCHNGLERQKSDGKQGAGEKTA